MTAPLHPDAKAFLERLRHVDVVKPMTKPSARVEPDKLPRCADCRKPRDLVRYGLDLVCRGCAAVRDRAAGFDPGDVA